MCKVAGPMLTSNPPQPSPKSKESTKPKTKPKPKPKQDELIHEEKMFKDANRDTFWQIKIVTYEKIEI